MCNDLGSIASVVHVMFRATQLPKLIFLLVEPLFPQKMLLLFAIQYFFVNVAAGSTEYNLLLLFQVVRISDSQKL